MNPTASFLQELFEYSHHFNQKLAVIFLENSEKIPEKSVTLCSHILNAHQVWNNRIELRQLLFGVWDVHPMEEFQRINQMNYEHSLSILDQLELDKTINYVNSQGQAFYNSIRDILFHVINHSTYHRGQIATALRQNGLEPLATDYIFHKRK